MPVVTLPGMHTVPRPNKVSIPLPPSTLDPKARVMLYELADDDNHEGWRIFQLADGSYTFELQAHGIVLLTEHHVSFADASARVARWYGNRLPQQAVAA
jgi:hypothetical protein